jgi:hypothetical protein
LHGDLTGRAGIGTVVARLAGLVRAHGPTRVLLIGGDSNQTGIGRELALAALLLKGVVLRESAGFVGVSMVTGVAVVSSFSTGNEGDKRGRAGGSNLELHCVEIWELLRGFFLSQNRRARMSDGIKECR